MDSLELRRIRFDPTYVYTLLLDMVDLNFDDFFALCIRFDLTYVYTLLLDMVDLNFDDFFALFSFSTLHCVHYSSTVKYASVCAVHDVFATTLK